MPRPWRIRYAGAKYHLTARGNGRETVFMEPVDYERFLDQLQEALEKDEVVLYAYVLMPNHYHLLVETPLGNVARFMQRLNTAYSMYFRYKKERPGHCFQGRYGAKLVNGDKYLVRLTRYIHLNPVKTRAREELPFGEKKRLLEGYRWSSYRSYAGLDAAREWVNYRWLRLMGRRTEQGNRQAYRSYIEEMMGKEDEVLQEARERSVYAVGDEQFAERTEWVLDAARWSKVDTGDIVWPERRRKPLEEVIGPIVKGLELEESDLRRHGRAVGVGKMMAIELLCTMSAASQREVARRCGYRRETSVGQQRRVLRERLEKESSLRRRWERVKQRVSRSLKAIN